MVRERRLHQDFFFFFFSLTLPNLRGDKVMLVLVMKQAVLSSTCSKSERLVSELAGDCLGC